MTWSDYYSLQFLRGLFAMIGAAMILYALYANHRDRPSLLWPKVTGTVMQCERVSYGSGGHSHYAVNIRYNYVVNGGHYMGNTIARWSPDWGDGRGTQQFAAEHPVQAPVDVFYESEHPENAVLVPGPDPRNRVLPLGGCIGFLGGIWFMFITREKAADVKARVLAAESQKRGPDSP
jgi:hypothetical protein